MRGLDSLISQTERRMLYSFSHPDWSEGMSHYRQACTAGKTRRHRPAKGSHTMSDKPEAAGRLKTGILWSTKYDHRQLRADMHDKPEAVGLVTADIHFVTNQRLQTH